MLHFPANDSNFKSPTYLDDLQCSTRITMTRSPKQTRLYLNNQISRSQALAHLAQNEINQCTVPAVQLEEPQSEAEDVDQEQDEVDYIGQMLFEHNFDSFAGSAASDFNWDSAGTKESSIDGIFPGEDLPAGDSYSRKQQLHVMLGSALPKQMT
jgi:hypothetical protein